MGGSSGGSAIRLSAIRLRRDSSGGPSIGRKALGSLRAWRLISVPARPQRQMMSGFMVMKE